MYIYAYIRTNVCFSPSSDFDYWANTIWIAWKSDLLTSRVKDQEGLSSVPHTIMPTYPISKDTERWCELAGLQCMDWARSQWLFKSLTCSGMAWFGNLVSPSQASLKDHPCPLSALCPNKDLGRMAWTSSYRLREICSPFSILPLLFLGFISLWVSSGLPPAGSYPEMQIGFWEHHSIVLCNLQSIDRGTDKEDACLCVCIY